MLLGRTTTSVGLRQEKRYGEAQSVPRSFLEGSQKSGPRGFGEMGTTGKNVGGLEVADRGITSRPLSGSHWRRCHLPVRRLESDKHRGWSMPVEGFRELVTTDGFVRSLRQVKCMCVVSCSTKS